MTKHSRRQNTSPQMKPASSFAERMGGDAAISQPPSRRFFSIPSILVTGLLCLFMLPLPAATAGDPEQPSEASKQMQHQRLVQILQEKLPAATPEATERAATDFINHLRQVSPIASDKFGSGQMDEDELKSRIDVFLLDHPELSGRPAPSNIASPRARVAEYLKGEAGMGNTDSERLSAADRFMERLGDLSGTARDSLVAGTMSDEELQSRVKVFAADTRADAAAVAADPAVAAVPAIVESFLKANVGPASERPNSICFRGEIESGGAIRGFAIFKKRARKIRIHIIEGGLVIGTVAFDGTAAWRQSAGQPAIPMVGSDADKVIGSARFDDPLVDYREHGTDVRLEDKQADGMTRLHIHETDGTEMVSTIDPLTFRELSLRTKQPDGSWNETKFRDYRMVGTLSVPYVQEEWRSGALYSTTRIKDVVLDPGLLDRFFEIPTSPYLVFMDYMSVLAKVQALEKGNKTPVTQLTGSAQ
jgi:hypothetical protein